MRLWAKALGAVTLVGCIGAISAHWVPGGSAHATAAEIQHDLETLHATAGADLMICEMKTKIERLNAEMQTSDAGKVESVRWQCAKDREQDLEAQIAKTKVALAGTPASLSLLKEWYAAWQASIEDIPTDGSEIDSTALDEKFHRLTLETRW